MLKHPNTKGFTLLELLIVIAIIAILSVILILVLNPTEALKKSRDTQRMADLATLKTALGIYLLNNSSPKLAGSSNAGCRGAIGNTDWQPSDYIYYSYPSDGPGGAITAKNLDGATFTTGGAHQVTSDHLGATDGTGWLPIDFTSIPGGSPISSLPIDPVNTMADPTKPSSTDLVYRYICSENSNQYEIAATLESKAYTVDDNKMAKSGGSPNYYKVGTNINLINTESPSTPSAPALAIGDSYQGGKIAYILQPGDPGYDPAVQHGLICAERDYPSAAKWAPSNSLVGTATGLGTGAANTNAIIANQGVGSYAAAFTKYFTDGGYNDWYLPSKDELSILYSNRLSLDGLNEGYDYWSSSENDANTAWLENFSIYPYVGPDSKGNYRFIHLIRSF